MATASRRKFENALGLFQNGRDSSIPVWEDGGIAVNKFLIYHRYFHLSPFLHLRYDAWDVIVEDSVASAIGIQDGNSQATTTVFFGSTRHLKQYLKGLKVMDALEKRNT